MKAIFLSASIPDPRRDPFYYRTADVVNIREAVRALTRVVLPRGRLVFGGHPTISPFVRAIAQSLGREDRVRIYQSRYFEPVVPPEHRSLPDFVWVDAVEDDREKSLAAMRAQMLDDEMLAAAVLIGGMEGVEEEFRLFRQRHPGKPTFPIPSTGGAALRLFNRLKFDGPIAERLQTDVAYELLFERLLGDILKTE